MAGKGGKRPGAGRKSKAEEMGLKALLDKCFTPDDREAVIKKLVALSKKGDRNAYTTLLGYTFGKPKEQVEHSGKDDGPLKVVVEYVHTKDTTAGTA